MAEVAAAANVSLATASRVLSNSTYPVRAETRDRVLAAASALDFRPNLLARGLVTSRTGIVGVIVHDISDPYFAEVVRGVEDGAAARGYQVLVSSSERVPERELEILELLLAYKADAVIFAGGTLELPTYRCEAKRLVAEFSRQGRAVVRLAPPAGGALQVTVDNTSAAAAMTRHLLELGHERIGLVSGPEHLSTSRLRDAGYSRALAAAGIPLDAELIAQGRFTSEGGRVAAGELAERGVTAIFATNDLMAFGVLQELNARGICVPGDVSVAGFDDVQAAQYVWPPLTTVCVPMRRLGRTGFEVALAALEGKHSRPKKLQASIVVRGTTARRS